MRPSQLGFELPQPPMGVIAVVLIGLLFAAVWGYNQVFVHHDPEEPVLIANSVKLAYHAGDVERISAQQKQTGRTTLPNGQSVDDYSSVDAIEDWRVIQVGDDGSATLGVKFEHLTGQFNGQDVVFNVNAAKEMQMVVSPDGRVVGGGTNGTAGGNATNSVPGSDQFFSILPDRDVHVGDTWGKEWERANPLGPGKVHYSTTNKFVRYDYLADGRAAVIDTVAKLPIDEVLNVRALLQLLGTDDPSLPANLSVTYRGNADVHMISFLSLENRRIEKSGIVANFDFDMTFQNLPTAPAYAPLKGTWHFGGHQDSDLTWLLPANSTPSAPTQ
jgi:hypothetical protein